MALARLIVMTQDRENRGSEDQPSWKNDGGDSIVVAVIDHAEASKGRDYLSTTYVLPSLPAIEIDDDFYTREFLSWKLYWDGELTESEAAGMEFRGVSHGCDAVGAGGAGRWCPIWTRAFAPALDLAA